jgi:hypothetical protein
MPATQQHPLPNFIPSYDPGLYRYLNHYYLFLIKPLVASSSGAGLSWAEEEMHQMSDVRLPSTMTFNMTFDSTSTTFGTTFDSGST